MSTSIARRDVTSAPRALRVGIIPKVALTAVARALLEDADERDAVAFDIDDTAVITVGSIVTANPEIKLLYNTAKRKKCKVYFITAREDNEVNLQFTKQQLKDLGYSKKHEVILTPADYRNSDRSGEWKRACRHFITDTHRLRFMVGDQYFDVASETLPMDGTVPQGMVGMYVDTECDRRGGILFKIPRPNGMHV